MESKDGTVVDNKPISHDTENLQLPRGSNDGPLSDTEAQAGVRGIKAITMTWTTKALIFGFVIMWLTYFVEGMLAGTIGALTPYVTSAFALHSLTPTVGIISSVVGGVINLTLAKILDVLGRHHAYLICIIIGTIGNAMMAACNNVEAYAAAQVFQTVGNNGIQYTMSVLIADTSSLQNRGLVQALASSPNLITCWLAGPIAAGFLNGPGWRWAFGMFTILVPCVSLPLYGILLRNFQKSKKLGLVHKSETQRSPAQSFLYYCRQFDAFGLLLLSVGFALFLLPFNLYTLQARGWNSPLVISMLVVGVVFLIAFVIWERFFAPITFIPYDMLLDRMVFGACLLSVALFLSYACWNSYFSSFLQVVSGLSVEHASYVVQANTVISVLCGIGAGAVIHYTGRFKPISLYVAVPLSILGVGLMIYFREPNGNVGYIVMCQIFVSVGSGILMISDEIAILTAASHQHVAVCIAIVSVFGSVGSAIGMTIASAIWQDIIPKSLLAYLPADQLENLPLIYADLNTQLSFPVGSETRLAIQQAYGDAQMRLLAAGTGVWVLGILGVLMWRNVNVIDIKQLKGHVW
ncbi:hypothetical protein NW762_009147 [Fusarium torreyae]|uniref:Major facilitator superfamily (MFS) profile domain-containing protein n=1 Tax=Fusarium torreyae TaxID=1237075 RepID=A0A9W8VBZ0_9HYPO|nr:hypothetical protein NW762_009147 [Fusarium torreyae]